MRWKFSYASVTGTSHASRGESGQDCCRAGCIQLSDADFFIGIAADGAGSTTMGGKGAEIACQTLYTRITEAVRESGDLSGITDDEVRSWITASREAVVTRAGNDGREAREYACTILGAVAGNGHAIFFQIGDGAIVIGPELRPVFWPEQGEYANSTYFITDEQYIDHLHILAAGQPDEIAMFTDGLQAMALSFSQKKAHPGFFLPFFDALKKNPYDGISDFSASLEQFLVRGDVSARSDDDKTLILAMRMAG